MNDALYGNERQNRRKVLDRAHSEVIRLAGNPSINANATRRNVSLVGNANLRSLPSDPQTAIHNLVQTDRYQDHFIVGSYSIGGMI